MATFSPILRVIGMAQHFNNETCFNDLYTEISLTVELLGAGCDPQYKDAKIKSVIWYFYSLETSNQ